MNLSTRTQDRITAALQSFEAGFTTKAAQKEALSALSRAYGEVYGRHHKWAVDKADAEFAHIDWATEEREDIYHARGEAIYTYHDLPFELHQVRDRHMAQFADIGAENLMTYLLGLREAFKAAEIVRVERDTKAEKVERVRESIVELMERRKAQYVEALDMGERFGGLPVSVNAHWVVNQFGTQFLRHYFFLNGKLTPLSVIIAAAEELERRKEV